MDNYIFFYFCNVRICLIIFRNRSSKSIRYRITKCFILERRIWTNTVQWLRLLVLGELGLNHERFFKKVLYTIILRQLKYQLKHFKTLVKIHTNIIHNTNETFIIHYETIWHHYQLKEGKGYFWNIINLFSLGKKRKLKIELWSSSVSLGRFASRMNGNFKEQ